MTIFPSATFTVRRTRLQALMPFPTLTSFGAVISRHLRNMCASFLSISARLRDHLGAQRNRSTPNARHVRAREIGTGRICVREIGVTEIGIAEIDLLQIGPRQVGKTQRSLRQIGRNELA